MNVRRPKKSSNRGLTAAAAVGGGTIGRPQEPGAYAVPGRASGLLPVWVRRRSAEDAGVTCDNHHIPPELRIPSVPPLEEPEQQSIVETPDESAVTANDVQDEGTRSCAIEASVQAVPNEDQEGPRTTKASNIGKRRLMGGFFLLLLVVTGVAVGLGIGLSSSGSSDSGSLAPTQAPSQQTCEWSDPLVRNNPLWQCFCHDELLALSDVEEKLYSDLKDTIVQPLLPDFDEVMASCAPANSALVQLVADGLAGAEVTRERFLVNLLYAIWNGPEWASQEGWLSRDRSICVWHGLGCDHDGSLVDVTLSFNGLVGTVPQEIVLLSNLEKLILNGNELEGTLPTTLFQMSTLKSLSLSSNFLVGSLPQDGSLSALSDLEELYLNFNQFSGSLPPALGDLSNLRILFVGDNPFSFETPTELGSMRALQVLSIQNTYLTGFLPSELGLLKNLTHLEALSSRSIVGRLPPELGELLLLDTLMLDYTSISGAIPTEIGGMKNLESLTLAHTRINGTIPSEVGQLTELDTLDLRNTEITGGLPSQLGDLMKLGT